jgi:hypothetical protein
MIWTFDSAKKLEIAIQVLYICVSCWLLDYESRDLSQAETEMIAVEKIILFVEISLRICQAFNESYFCLSLR